MCYADLTQVTHLDLSSNKLTELPPSLDKMINLEYLNLSDNQLTSLPKSILHFEKLTSIVLHGNNFELKIDSANMNHSDLADLDSGLFK